tara:strand:+ start:5505 stop:5711 length:207 start_codon:yes stop_codon:yes gene_type:complete
MNYYVVSFESVRHGEEGAPWFGKKIIRADNTLEAQDKYFDWLRKQPEYINGIKRLFFAVDETTQDVIE